MKNNTQNTTINLFSLKLIIYCLPLLLLVNGCEDPIPTDDYIARPFVQGFLIVDEPIETILLSYSQPINKVYNHNNAIIKDADIIVYTKQDTMPLIFRNSEIGGEYYCADTTVKVKPMTQYFIRVRLKDGTELTASTTTPDRIRYTKPPKSVLQFPSDTNNLNVADTSLNLKWTPEKSTKEYLIRVTCLDTLEYGKYLNPATNESNYRRTRLFDSEFDPRTDNPTEYGFITTTTVPTVWNAFKWFGPHEIVVYAADRNFAEWFKMSFTGNSLDFLKSNIKGNGIGVFGSASQAFATTLLLKYPKSK